MIKLGNRKEENETNIKKKGKIKMSDKKVKTIKNNPTLEKLAVLVPDVVFSTATGTELKMQIMKPWIFKDKKDTRTYPLVVFVQGSSWTFPNVYKQIPQLSELAREGYVVATITHRNSLEGHPFPAFLEDVKTAIRFLRKNAVEYNIDPERVAIWGTSSGGNAALLTGITGDNENYKTEEYKEYSDAVNVVVDCFGPTDVLEIAKYVVQAGEASEFFPIFHAISGGKGKEHMEIFAEMSPYLQLEKDKNYPPFLIMQGDKDNIVSYDQSLKMYQKLLDYGYEAEMVCVENAPHEDTFWSQEIFEIVKQFLEKYL